MEKTNQCMTCSRRVKLHTFQNDFEANHCFTCRILIKALSDWFLTEIGNKGLMYYLGFAEDHKIHTLKEVCDRFEIVEGKFLESEYVVFSELYKHNLKAGKSPKK